MVFHTVVGMKYQFNPNWDVTKLFIEIIVKIEKPSGDMHLVTQFKKKRFKKRYIFAIYNAKLCLWATFTKSIQNIEKSRGFRSEFGPQKLVGHPYPKPKFTPSLGSNLIGYLVNSLLNW